MTSFSENIKKLTGEFNTNNEIKDVVKQKTNFLFIFFSLIFIGGALLYYMSTNTMIVTNYTYSIFIFILFFFAIFIYFAKSSQIAEFNVYHLVVGTLCIALLWLLIDAIDKISSNGIFIFNYIVYAIIGLILIIGLAIFYIIFKNYLQKQTGVNGLLITFLFYIPCLLTDILQWLRGELNITPSIVFILLMLEIILGLAYLYVPKILQKKLSLSSNTLLKGPVSLNEKTIISDEKPFLKDSVIFKNTNTQLPSNNIYKTNQLSISFWVILNVMPTETNIEETIIRLSSNSNTGRPALTFKKGEWHLYLSDNINAKPYSFKLPPQKWHYFAIQYLDSRADIFINGKLNHTVEWTNDIPHTIDDTYEFVAGTHKGNLDGAICSINVSTTVLNEFMITQAYNYWKYQNPPTLVSL